LPPLRENWLMSRLDLSEAIVERADGEIKKQEQLVAKLERQLALLKMKERKRDTRKKIELGGLVVKAKMDGYPKSIILGALIDALEQIENSDGASALFQSKGEAAFMGYGDFNSMPDVTSPSGKK
jgi:hypothetical protein